MNLRGAMENEYTSFSYKLFLVPMASSPETGPIAKSKKIKLEDVL